jgi:hypothetical protein
VVDDAHIHALTLVEPAGGHVRPNRMFADTDAIRAFGAASMAQASELGAIAAALSAMPSAAADSMLGPVGARFLAALADATTDASRAVATLSDRLEAGHFTARASATAYETADHRLGAAVSRL